MFNRAIVTNISKYNLTEKANTSSFVKKISVVKILMKLKKDTWYIAHAHSIYYAR